MYRKEAYLAADRIIRTWHAAHADIKAMCPTTYGLITRKEYNRVLRAEDKRLSQEEREKQEQWILQNAKNETHISIKELSLGLTGTGLLTEEEIVMGAKPAVNNTSGVYFLIHNKKVVYVGQSKNVYSRAFSHPEKDFDSFTFIQCPPVDKLLDILESIYIHYLKPKLNGYLGKDKRIHAPVPFNLLCTLHDFVIRTGNPVPGEGNQWYLDKRI